MRDVRRGKHFQFSPAILDWVNERIDRQRMQAVSHTGATDGRGQAQASSSDGATLSV
jgi:hypothetical protein